MKGILSTVQSDVPAVRKRGRPTAAERRAREAQILSAALEVFLRSGFGNATISELAIAARVTKRTVYAYFGDKPGVFAAMVTDLATGVSIDDAVTLKALAARIVYRVHSDELVGLHRLIIAESTRFPELASVLHAQGDARHIARLAGHIRAERGPEHAELAEPLFSLLLGERHRRRLLGLDPAPSQAQAAAHANKSLGWLGLLPGLDRRVGTPWGLAEGDPAGLAQRRLAADRAVARSRVTPGRTRPGTENSAGEEDRGAQERQDAEDNQDPAQGEGALVGHAVGDHGGVEDHQVAHGA
jgi:AcrR family transcriptional regulator